MNHLFRFLLMEPQQASDATGINGKFGMDCLKTTVFFVVIALIVGPVSAATISVQTFSHTAYAAAIGSMEAAVFQNFESYGEGNVANGFSTNLGTFASLGGVGSGGTVNDADFANDGSRLALRSGNVFGRTSSTFDLTSNSDDDMFLDSNDTFGIVWTVWLGAGRVFDRLVFSLTDAAEFGDTLWITTGEASATVENGGNAQRHLVEITFAQSVSSATVTLGHFNEAQPVTNDGFSIDDLAVNTVPLPASTMLLLVGLVGLGTIRRRD